MPQYDLYHYEVKNALSKDGWTITHDPYTLEYKGLRLYADLGAEKLLAAERAEQKIAVETKVFHSPSQVTELQKAIGQYNMYQSILNRVSPDRALYLAISEEIYDDFFQKPAIQDIVSDQNIQLIIFDPDREVIIKWLT
ncbi:element excision factor XisH family protein [Spirulina sp. 06S082]|uniref:element excision factor XisH family protein n=1 Tax=Spirulina sp. 06S082 TaxID=3110248 RepID=UPI002B214296|nr:element excision factor XisH family protein [Spirulina sp. 06S082]MEA5471335.1 element excision factor XisH family protein [Spirulina sp. 06S082]